MMGWDIFSSICMVNGNKKLKQKRNKQCSPLGEKNTKEISTGEVYASLELWQKRYIPLKHK